MVRPGNHNCNQVAEDQIWKAHVNNELMAAKRWPSNWSFLSKLTKEMSGEDVNAPPGEAAMKAKNRQEALKLPPIDPKMHKKLAVGKSTIPIPETSSAIIGWRSTQTQCMLERYGRYTKPKQTFLRQMKWSEASIV